MHSCWQTRWNVMYWPYMNMKVTAVVCFGSVKEKQKGIPVIKMELELLHVATLAVVNWCYTQFNLNACMIQHIINPAFSRTLCKDCLLPLKKMILLSCTIHSTPAPQWPHIKIQTRRNQFVLLWSILLITSSNVFCMDQPKCFRCISTELQRDSFVIHDDFIQTSLYLIYSV